MTVYINTPEELDALPDFAVILTSAEIAYQKDGNVWVAAGSRCGTPSRSMELPMTLIHRTAR